MDRARSKAYSDLISHMDDNYGKPDMMRFKKKPGFEEGEGDDELQKGIEVEMEHTDSREEAEKIAMDHLAEDPKYYSNLEAMKEGSETEHGEEITPEEMPEHEASESPEEEKTEDEKPKGFSLHELIRSHERENQAKAPSHEIDIEIRNKKKKR